MSSAATRNSRQASARSRRSRGTGDASRKIRFTLVFDSLTDEVVLDEHQTVKILAMIVESRFKIPMEKQLIYGWPGVEPNDFSMQFKDLGLDSDVLLYVATTGGIENDEELLSLVVPDADGERPGTSSNADRTSSNADQASDSRSSRSDENVTCQLHVRDLKNNEVYDEIPVEGYYSILQVKELFGGLTDIPREFQEWSGWPEGVTDNQLLKDIDLDKPFHSLVIMDTRQAQTNGFPSSSQTENVRANDPTKSEAMSSSSQKANIASSGSEPETHHIRIQAALDDPAVDLLEMETVPSVSQSDVSNNVSQPIVEAQTIKIDNVESKKNGSTGPKSRTARKSTSKGALRDLSQRMNRSNLLEVNGNVAGEDTDSMNESNVSNVFDEANGSSQHVDNSAQEARRRSMDIIPGPSTPKKSRLDDNQSQSQSPSKSSKQRCPLILTQLTKLPGGEDKLLAAKTLLAYLDPLTQLSLRRVCKATKELVSCDRENMQREEEKWQRFRLTVTGMDYKRFENVVNMNLPITRFVFDTNFDGFYDREDIDCFIQFYFARVKDVTLKKFYMFQHSKEREMFETFVNLEKLTIDELSIPNTSTIHPCPKTLGQLEILKLNYEILIPEENVLIRPKCWDMTWGMLADCHRLLYFRFPRMKETCNLTSSFGVFAPLLEYISMRQRGDRVSLEYLDLKHYNNPESFYITRFVELLRRCHQKDIKLKNIHSLVVQEVFDEGAAVSDDAFKFCENIVSLINYSRFVENAPLRNLEKITVDVIPSVKDYVSLGKGYKDMFWPKLRVIKIKDTVQQNKEDGLWKCWQEAQEDLYGHNGIFDRGSVQYIKIDSPRLPYFLSEGRLADKFYNLKRLEIVAWCNVGEPDRVLNKRLNAIWKKLRLLEELRIENCPRLNDCSFTGEEDDDTVSPPPFLNLANSLKKLTLGLDNTNVTDESLIRVFSKMPIKTFILLSTQPTKITEKGLLKLRERKFGQYIEYFPFHGWFAAKIDARRFERLGKSFRSMR